MLTTLFISNVGMISTMFNQNPRLFDLIKIYWSISWRANVLGFTIFIIFLCLNLLFLNLLINSGELEFFRKYIFLFLPFSPELQDIKEPSLSISLYFGFWSFAWDYLFFWYGFRRVLKYQIYPDFFQTTIPFATYSKVFLVPLMFINFIDLQQVGFKHSDSTSCFAIMIFVTLMYYSLIFILMKRTLRKITKAST